MDKDSSVSLASVKGNRKETAFIQSCLCYNYATVVPTLVSFLHFSSCLTIKAAVRTVYFGEKKKIIIESRKENLLGNTVFLLDSLVKGICSQSSRVSNRRQISDACHMPAQRHPTPSFLKVLESNTCPWASAVYRVSLKRSLSPSSYKVLDIQPHSDTELLQMCWQRHCIYRMYRFRIWSVK